jgi:hypothetical protein
MAKSLGDLIDKLYDKFPLARKITIWTVETIKKYFFGEKEGQDYRTDDYNLMKKNSKSYSE